MRVGDEGWHVGLLSNIMGPQGLVGYYHLTDWWVDLFTPQETDALEKAYARRPAAAGSAQRGMGAPGLTRGMTQASRIEQSPARFVAGLASLVGQVAHDKEPAVWAKAEELALESGDLLDLHLVYSGAVKAFYARRDEDEDYLDAALEAAVELVSMADEVAAAYRSRRPGRALPPHRGYKLLVVLAERRDDTDEALSLSRRALEQGWAGDWKERVSRLESAPQAADAETPAEPAADADAGPEPAAAPGDEPAAPSDGGPPAEE